MPLTEEVLKEEVTEEVLVATLTEVARALPAAGWGGGAGGRGRGPGPRTGVRETVRDRGGPPPGWHWGTGGPWGSRRRLWDG